MKVLVIGAGLVGGAAMSAVSERGHDIVGVSRSSSPAVDATDPDSITALFAAVGTVDAVVAAVGSAPYEPLSELDHGDFLKGLLAKGLAQIDIVQLGERLVRRSSDRGDHGVHGADGGEERCDGVRVGGIHRRGRRAGHSDDVVPAFGQG